MPWPPFFTLDLLAQGALPSGWDDDLRAVARGPDGTRIVTGPEPDAPDEAWSYDVFAGDVLRRDCGWLLPLYLGAMLDFVRSSFDRPLVPANRLRSAMTLNVMAGAGATLDWHSDHVPVTGVFFGTTAEPEDGGELGFRDGAGGEAGVVPKAGSFVCFEGRHEHQVAALRRPGTRMSLSLLFFESAADQQPAYKEDVYL